MEAKRVLFEKDLPDQFKPLIDSSKPLPANVQYFEGPPATKKGAAGWLALAGISALAAVVCFLIAFKNRSSNELSGEHMIMMKFFGGGVVCILLTIGWLWKAKLDYKQAQAADAGVAERKGLFLTPDTLLVWHDLSRLFPRDKVISYTTSPVTKDGVVFLNSEFKFMNANGEEESMAHLEFFLEGESQAAAAIALETWSTARQF